MPLHHFLRQFFAKDKKYGSKDRRWISHFCYSFYRLGKAFSDMDKEKRMPISVYLCTEKQAELVGYFPENWPLDKSLDEKIAFIHHNFGLNLTDIFPYQDLIMPEIDLEKLAKSMLIQPDVFLRIRPGRKSSVLKKLEELQIPFQIVKSDCLAVNNRTAVDKALQLNKDAVIQDLNSQNIAELFPKTQIDSIWDCCAASGGKTILIHDKFPNASITVSDIRASILKNHRQRMEESGISIHKYYLADLTTKMSKEQFDLVLCDAPCSGSGTWSRNPEELYFFNGDLENVTALQQQIVQNIWPSVRPGGYLLYITCSLFAKENEPIPILLSQNMCVIEQKIWLGYTEKADSLFGILIKK